MLTALTTFLTLSGCAPGPCPDDQGRDNDGVCQPLAMADADTDTDSDTDTGSLKASLTGTIMLPDGGAAENFRVNVCKEVCITAKTAADGSYTVVGIAAGTASLYIQATGESNYAVPYAPLPFAESEVKALDLTLREIDGTTDLSGNEEHWLGEWGVLDADASTYETALGDAVTEVTWSQTEGPVEQPPVEIEGQTVLGLIYLGTFEAEGAGSLRLASPGNLPVGTVVNVYYAELPEVSAWTLGGSLTAIDGEPLLDGVVDLPVLTALALTMPN